MGFQVTVINDGDPVTVGGILFASGETVVGAATLELMADLGLVNSIRTPFFRFNAGEDDALAGGSIVFTGAAAAHIT